VYVNISPDEEEPEKDHVRVFRTSGSGGGSKELIAEFIEGSPTIISLGF
jgi:hypothetical protein